MLAIGLIKVGGGEKEKKPKKTKKTPATIRAELAISFDDMCVYSLWTEVRVDILIVVLG